MFQINWKIKSLIYKILHLFRLGHQDFRDFFLKSDCEILEEIKGKYGIEPKIISDRFDPKDKETFILWGHFLLKFK